MRRGLVALVICALLGFSSSVSAAVTYCATSAYGYGASATGGGSATPVLVSSTSELSSALNKAKNKVIIITKSLTFTKMLSVQDGANVTLLGLPGVTLTSLEQTSSTSGILYVKRFNNLIIRNLTFVGPGAYDCDGNDLLCFESVTNAWVDHCDFQDGCDGNFDNKKLSDNVTISWCRFRYLKAPKPGGSGGADDHRFTNLLGSSSSDKPSDGTFNYTWAYCWWDNGCKERMVRCRNCELHFMNCYWNSSVANYYVGPENAKCYFEGCTFEGKANSSSKIFKSYGGTNACYFTDCSGNLPSNSGTVPNPHSSYTVTASGRAEAKTAVTNATCGAGATLTVTTAGAVSSTCDGGAPLPTVWTVTWDATTNGGSCGTATSSVTNGAAIGTLPEATKTSFNFDGWYTAPSGGTKITSSTVITGNVTYYAQFTSAPVTTYYTVIWDANGGTCGTSSSSIESGQQIGTLPVASKAGDYSFDGWYTAINGGTKISTTTTVTGNVTYYAHYTATGGGGGGGDCTYTYAFAYAADATTAGVTNNTAAFTGFSTGSNNCTGSITIGSNTYNITKRGSNTTISISFTVPTDKVGTLYGLANSGGSSVRTLTLSDGGSYSENQSTSNSSSAATEITFSSLSAGNYTLSSTQNVSVPFLCLMLCDEGGSTPPATYTLSYDENGGSGTMADQTGTSVTVKANEFTAPMGYSFEEWNTEMSGGETTKKNVGDAITLTEDMTLYAIWKPNTYTVTLNAEGGDGGTANVTATFDAAMPVITIPSRDGYTFKGYYTEMDGAGTQYYDENGSGTNSWTRAENTTLHAYWEAGSSTPVTGCDLHFWFIASADATTNGKSNDGTVFSSMVADANDRSGSITIDGTSYSVTRRTGDPTDGVFGSFTVPSGYTGVFYALAISSGSGDREIDLVGATDTYELDVPGGSDSYKRIESDELPAGTYSIQRNGGNVRLGVVVVKLCTSMPASDAPTITVQPVGATYCTGDAVSALSVTASGSGTLSYQWKKDGVAIPSAEDYTYAPTEAGTYVCVVTNTESGKTPTSLSSDEAVVVIKAAVAAPTMSQTENTVTISTATSGATIYYTTNGTDPTTSSASGSSVTITADCTVKAYAVKDGCASSVTSFAATYDASACAEPALMTNEIARFFVPCGTGTIKYEVTDEASSTGMNTFSTYKLGSTSASNWYTNSTSKWSYGKMSSDTYIQIKLNTGHFQAYDKVYIYVNRNDASKTGVKLHSTSGNAINPASTAADEEAVGVRSLTDEDIETDGSLKFYRGGSNTFINRIIVVRPVPHSITYDCDGAESGCPSNVASAYALPNPLPNAPVKSGYSFDGWFTNSEKTVAAVAGAELTDDVTLYAKWSVGKNSPVFTWTYDATIKAGGTYPVSVATYGDADVTLSIKETIAGVTGSFTAGKPATGTVTLGSYPAAATFTYRATSPETTQYAAKEEEKTVTIERCETADDVTYDDTYVNSGSSTIKPQYFHEVSGVGRIMKGKGGSGYSSSTDGGTFSGIGWTKSVKNQDHEIQTYENNIIKVVFYVKCTDSGGNVNKLRRSESHINSESEGEDILPSTSKATIIYNNDPSQTTITQNEYETITIIPATPLEANDFLYIKFNKSNTYVWGVKLYRAEGDEATSVAFSGETEIEKYPGDAAFTKTATQTTTPILSGGSITYKSSDETVATVNKTTGEVTVLNTGRTNIIATLSAFGCFKSATASYSLTVKKCTDPVCTIAVTVGNANKCSGAEVTLTATAAAGASIQWYKDGVALAGETNPSLSTTAPGTYHATATKECLQKSNTIDVVNFADPTAEALHQYYYIKAGRVTPPIKLFQIANASSWDVSPAAPAGCAYELGEDGIIYLTGTPSASLTIGNQDITVTAHNDCGGSDAQATLNLRTLAATAKPQIAWVAIGTHLDGSDVKPTKGETLPGSVDASKSTSHVLYTYLQNYFDMTAVNAYCTTDTKKISDYCSQFDLVLLTDYPDTNVKPDGESGGKEKSYSNAYGCLMDELPLLSFEAFVADCPNWGINSNPKTPDPKQKDMTLLCSAHMIFEHTTLTDDVVEFLTTTDGAGNALQGFTSIDAPSGMIFIATINDGSNKLIVCCERQKVIEARMMIMGLNYDAMEKVSADGKTIIKQIIEYLLQFKDIADCSIVFDDNNGTHVWSDPQNWYPAYNAVPKAEQAVRVDKPCNVDIENAHCSSIRLRKDGATYDGKLTIQPNGGLTVIDYIKEVHGTNYMTTYPSAAADLVIQANESGRNGSLVFGNTEDDLQATVEYYSLARDAKTSSPVWQYIGIPITDGPMAIDAYHAAWMCSWENEGNVSSNWVWVENEDRIRPFKGYCITQQATKKYTHIGSLSKPEAKDLQMYYFESDDGNGFNMFANSWVAPIDITKMATADFGGAAEPTIFIYNTGSRDQYEGGGAPSTAGTNTDAGQFNAIPVAAASYLTGSLTKIPTMQGFFVQATKEGTLTLNYEKLCFDNTDYQTTAETMRAPKRLADDAPEAEQIVPEVMRLDVTSAKWGDRVYILTHEEFSDAFDRGWDGSKQEGDAAAPMLAVAREKGLLAVAAIETAEGRDLYFRAGEDIEYTFTFHYAGDDIYLYDRETGQATLIRTGNTYTFSAMNQAPEKRFIITANPLQTPTDIDHVQGDDVQRTKAKKFIYEDKLLIFYRGTVYDVLGAPVQTRKEDAQ